jgi:hypothetical protein
VVLLPGVTGHYGVKGGGALLPHRGVVRPQLQRDPQAVGPAPRAWSTICGWARRC